MADQFKIRNKEQVTAVDTKWDVPILNACVATKTGMEKPAAQEECGKDKFYKAMVGLESQVVGFEDGEELKEVCKNIRYYNFALAKERLAAFKDMSACKAQLLKLPVATEEEASRVPVLKQAVSISTIGLDLIPDDLGTAFFAQLDRRWGVSAGSARSEVEALVRETEKADTDFIALLDNPNRTIEQEVMVLQELVATAKEIDGTKGFTAESSHIVPFDAGLTIGGHRVEAEDIYPIGERGKIGFRAFQFKAKLHIDEVAGYVGTVEQTKIDEAKGAVDSADCGPAVEDAVAAFERHAIEVLTRDKKDSGGAYPAREAEMIEGMPVNGWLEWARLKAIAWFYQNKSVASKFEPAIAKIKRADSDEAFANELRTVRIAVERDKNLPPTVAVLVEDVGNSKKAADKALETANSLKGAGVVLATEAGYQNEVPYGIFLAQTNGVEAELSSWLYLTGEARVIVLDLPPDVTRSGNPIGVYEDPKLSGLLIDKLNFGLKFLLSGKENTLTLRGGLFDPRKKQYENDHSDITDFAYPAGSGWGVDATFKLWTTEFERFGDQIKSQKSGFRAKMAAYDPAKILLNGDAALAQFDSLSDSLMVTGDVGYMFTPVNWLTLTPQILFAKGVKGEGIKEAEMVTPSLIADLYLSKQVKVMMDGFYSVLNGDQDVWAVSLKPYWIVSERIDLYSILTLSNTNIPTSRGSIIDGATQESYSGDETISSLNLDRRNVDVRGGIKVNATDWFAVFGDGGVSCIEPGGCSPSVRGGIEFIVK